MGNCSSWDEFDRHFRFLAPELYRITKPGRLLSFHCMLLPTSKAMHGHIGLYDFRGDLIRAFQACGWIFHSEVVIWKDPVTAMQRTKALGLLHKTIRSDSSMSRQGIPDYLVTMRKPGKNEAYLAHFRGVPRLPLAALRLTRLDGHQPVRYVAASKRPREDDDEAHLPAATRGHQACAKALDQSGRHGVSPFTGIGSEGYVAIQEGRRFVGAELKRSYYEQAARNLREADPANSTQTGFSFG